MKLIPINILSAVIFPFVFSACVSQSSVDFNKQQAAKVIETTERPKLSDIEMFVFTEIKNNPKITRTELSNTVGRSVRSIQRIANTLVEKGYLIRIGNNQFGYWEVVH